MANSAHTLAVVTLTEPQLVDLLRQAAQDGATAALIAHAEQAAQLPRWLSRSQLGNALGISLPTVDRLTAAGMPCTRVGSHRRYHLPAVQAWLDQREGR